MERIDCALIGCGRMGLFTSEAVRRHAPACWHPLSHAEAIAAHPMLRLLALADVDPLALARAASALGVDAAYDDPRRLLDELHPLLVCIATRTPGRAGLIGAAVAAGARALHVEKPLCNGVSELASLRRVFARPDVHVTYGAIRRFFPIYRQARALSDSGRYGALREIRVSLGSGSLFWTHPHAVDLILFGAGDRRIAGVQARLADVQPASGHAIESDPRIVGATIHFDDGATGHITQALGSDFVLSCADAEIVVRGDGSALEIYRAEGDSPYPTLSPGAGLLEDGPGGTLGPLSQLVACLAGSAAAIAANDVVKRDVLAGQQVLFAMLQSHLSGSRIIEPDAADDTLFVQARTGGRAA